MVRIRRTAPARHLERRYQHIYNVLKAATPSGSDALANRQPEARGVDRDVHQLVLGKDGSVRLPAAWLAEQRLGLGDALFCRVDGNGFTIMSRAAAVAALRQVARSSMPGQASLLEALLGADTEQQQ